MSIEKPDTVSNSWKFGGVLLAVGGALAAPSSVVYAISDIIYTVSDRFDLDLGIDAEVATVAEWSKLGMKTGSVSALLAVLLLLATPVYTRKK